MPSRFWLAGVVLLGCGGSSVHRTAPESRLSPSAQVTARPRPIIERIEPTSGPVGTEVQVIGRRVYPGRFTLGSHELPVVQGTPNRAVVLISPGSATGDVVVETTDGIWQGPQFRVTQAAPSPVVERTVPSTGAPGTEVVLHGQNFSTRVADNSVLLGGQVVVVRTAMPNELRVVVPTGATSGPFIVRVTGAAGQCQSAPFTVTDSTAIASFEPARGPGGTRVTVRGSGFATRAADNRVFVGNVAARIERVTPTEMIILVAGNATTGKILIDIEDKGRAESAEPFIVQDLPVIRAMEPDRAPPGGTFTIRGANFGDDPRVAQVHIGAAQATVREIAHDRLLVEVPPGTTPGKVKVSIAGLEGHSSSDFTVLLPVGIASFEPGNGPAGSVLTIRGQGFSATAADNTVTLSGQRAQVLRVSPTELSVRVPTAASGPVTVNVRHNGSATSTGPFMVTTPPFVAGIDPRLGAPGTELTIRGAHFGTQPSLVQVTLGGAPLEIVSVADDRIVARVTTAARSGRPEVTVRLQGTAQAAQSFDVAVPFAAAVIEPSEGFPGTAVEVRGVGFSNRTVVTFSGVSRPAEIVSAREAVVRVLVPEGAQSGNVSVTAPDGRVVVLPTPFTVRPMPEGLAITEVDAECFSRGCTAVLRGYGFTRRRSRNSVRFGDIAVRLKKASATELTIELPNALGTHPFTVKVGDAEAQSSPVTLVAPAR